MLYRAGTIEIFATGQVMGTNTEFLQNVGDSSTLTIANVVGAYPVARVVSNTELWLTALPALPPNGSLKPKRYAISSDFTPILTVPYPNRGESDSNHLLTRAFDVFDIAVPQP